MSKENEVKPPFADDLELRKFLCIHAREWRGLSSYWQFYQALIAAAPQSPQWISVEERVPDEHKGEYLCLFSDGHQQVSEWLHDEIQGWVFWYGDPTHWMPLPAPPQ